MVVTSIVGQNKELFQNLAPQYILEGMKEDYRFGIGLLDVNEESQSPQAAGILIFDMLDGTNEENDDLMTSVIQWFYIAETYRKQGAADQLMQEYLSVLTKAGLRYVMCDLPLASEYDQLCSYLQTWHFTFGLTDQYELILSLKELLQGVKLPQFSENSVVSLGETPVSTFREYIAKQAGGNSYLSAEPADYDRKVSCCYLEKGKITSALLVKKITDNYVEICSLEMIGDRRERLTQLMAHAKKEAEKRYSPDTYVRILCTRTPVAKVLFYFFPDREPLLVRRGVLDLLEENWEEEV